MWIEFLNINNIPYTFDDQTDRLTIFDRDVQKDTVYSWIKKSRKHNLTSHQISTAIQYSLPFEVLTEMTIEELLQHICLEISRQINYCLLTEKEFKNIFICK